MQIEKTQKRNHKAEMWLMVQVSLLFLFCYCTNLVTDFYLTLFVELLLFIKTPVFTLSAVYFRLSVHSGLLFSSAFWEQNDVERFEGSI